VLPGFGELEVIRVSYETIAPDINYCQVIYINCAHMYADLKLCPLYHHRPGTSLRNFSTVLLKNLPSNTSMSKWRLRLYLLYDVNDVIQSLYKPYASAMD
jgi:hypothetical protein